jgi:hypothetical protein
MRKTIQTMSLIGAVAALSACGGGSSGDGTGQAKVSVTDGPVENVQQVVFTFDSIDVKPANGSPIHFDVVPARTINLLEFTDGNAFVVLPPVDLPAGDYQWLRLNVVEDDSFVVRDDGGTEPIKLPSEKLKLIRGFTVPDGGLVALTVDFDLRKALVDPPGQDGFILKPVLRVVEDDEVGQISGVIAGDFIDANAATCGDDAATGEGYAVYVYAGANATPNDVTDSGGPLVTAQARPVGDGVNYRYTVAYLPAGSYTVAFTCQAEDDDPLVDGSMVFPTQANASVTAGAITPLNLPQQP